MDINVKNLADSGDIKSLKYLFVDSLDVDPTFVRYEEDYNYCKSVPGLLETHIELTPFSNNEADWDEAYWAKLKMDLIKNFSNERMSHMRKVAKTFLADKVERILAERSRKVEVKEVEKTKVNVTPTPSTSSAKAYPSKEEQERILAEERRKLEREQLEFEAKQEAERKRREEQRRRILEQSSQRVHTTQSGTVSKKVIGIAAAAVAVTLTAVAIYVLLK